MGAYPSVTRLVFWVEASQSAGVGHLFRCMALAQAAEEQGLESVFVLTPEAAEIARAQHEWNFVVHTCNSDQQVSELRQQLSLSGTSVLVLDGYTIPIQQARELAIQADLTMVMDDGECRLTELADIIVNPATTHLNTDYHRAAPRAALCTGRDYRLLRIGFRHWEPIPFEQRHGVVMCFGGSDPAGLTANFIAAFEQAGADMPVRVITGPANTQLAAIKEACRSASFPAQHIHDCQDMPAAWGHARLAVSAAGGSQFEIGVCQTPALLITVADNQLAASEQAASEGWCEVMSAGQPVERLANRALALYEDGSTLSEMHHKAGQYYDARGAERVLTALAGVLHD